MSITTSRRTSSWATVIPAKWLIVKLPSGWASAAGAADQRDGDGGDGEEGSDRATSHDDEGTRRAPKRMTGPLDPASAGYTRPRDTWPRDAQSGLVHHDRRPRGRRQDDAGRPARVVPPGRGDPDRSGPASRAAPRSGSGSATCSSTPDAGDQPIDPLADALLFNAARRQLVERGDPAGSRGGDDASSAPASPTRRSPTRATARVCRSRISGRSRRVATGGLRPDLHDPARPAAGDRAAAARRRTTGPASSSASTSTSTGASATGSCDLAGERARAVRRRRRRRRARTQVWAARSCGRSIDCAAPMAPAE